MQLQAIIQKLKDNPNDADLWNQAGIICLQNNKLQSALSYLQYGYTLEPSVNHAINFSEALRLNGRFLDAINILQKSIEDGNKDFLNDLLFNLALNFKAIGEIEKAINTYETLLKDYSKDHLAKYNLANLYAKINNTQGAKALYIDVMKNANSSTAFNAKANLANLFFQNNEFTKSLNLHLNQKKRRLILFVDFEILDFSILDIEFLLNLALTLEHTHKALAFKAYFALLPLCDSGYLSTRAKLNLAYHFLRLSLDLDIDLQFRKFLYSSGTKIYKTRENLGLAVSESTTFEGIDEALIAKLQKSKKSLNLNFEQGFGDSLLFLRYLPKLKRISVNLHLQEPLRSLFSKSSTDNLRILKDGNFSGIVHQIPSLMGLAPIFELKSDYLNSSINLKSNTRDKKLKIAIFTNSNKNFIGSDKKQINIYKLLSYFRDLAGRIEFYNLNIEGDFSVFVDDFCIFNEGKKLKDFSSTAKILHKMDLLICADTAILHLNEALGKKSFVILPPRYDWRFGALNKRVFTPLLFPNTTAFVRDHHEPNLVFDNLKNSFKKHFKVY